MVRVAYVLVIMPRVELGADAVWYFLQAGTIADGIGYVDPAAYYERGQVVASASFPPLWPTVLGVGKYLRLLGSQRSYELVGAVVGTGTVVATGFLGRRVAGEGVGLTAAALAAVCPFLIAADGSLMSDGLFVAAMTLSVLLAYRAASAPGPWPWVLLGAALGTAALTRSDALVLAPVLVVVVALRVPDASWRWRVVLGTLSLAVAGGMVAVWAVRNTVAMDEIVIVSNNSGSLLEGANCARTYGGDGLGRWEPDCLRATGAEGLSEAEAARRARNNGVRYARDHVERLPVVVAVRVLRGWGFYDPVDQSRSEAVESRHADWQVAGWVFSTALVPVAIVGAVVVRRRDMPVAPLLAVAGGATLLLALSWGNQRFRLTAEPVMLVLAAVALTGQRRSSPAK
jgi:4-amino-4-deoxy-L-arabinose transferase-like glycosyltransferase